MDFKLETEQIGYTEIQVSTRKNKNKTRERRAGDQKK